jgi:Inositol 1,3,4-trisphosphate 5/6-kinase ATP-grasp domain/Haloacid dehalogenase-like hydrolase/Inositol 1,3,4-trisphosphate 5/6-kinase pre-ATP-grasp domain
VKHEHMLQRLGITPLIDHFAVSSYIGVRKPNPEMISYLLNKIKLTPEEIIVVGDLLDRDILMGNLAGARTVWINAIPYSLDQNLKRITEGDQKYLPTAGIVCLAQLIPTLNYIQNLSPGPGQVRVGYYFPSIRKKLETGKQGAFVSNERVFYMPIELRAPIEHLGDFDVIVHKITDLLLSGDPKDRDGVVNLQNYISSRPNVLILDPVDGLQYTNSRKAFLTMWKTANVNGVNVRCPLVYSGNQISFPCIIKTDVACQLKGSHDMAVVHTQEAYDKALSRFFLPVVVQEWISCEAMYKVYILGDRYSISNQQFLSVDQEELHFNSTNIPDGVLNKNITLDQEVVKKINWTLKENTGLGMLSYDLALEKGTGDYVLIDLNYFPGYYTMSDYKDAMDDYIIQSYTRFRNKLG